MIIAKLLIPESAGRVNSIGSRKCRASHALVLSLEGQKEAEAIYNHGFKYKAGETVFADSFDPSPFVECSNGIHFFITKEEAEAYEG